MTKTPFSTPSLAAASHAARHVSGSVLAALFLSALSGFAVGACGSSGSAGTAPRGGAAAGEGGETASGGSTARAGSRSGISLGGTGGTGATGGKSTIGAAGTSAASAGDAGSGTVVGTGSACDNGIDDDGDGLIDGLDPECTGPLDNDEGSFATGIPGDNKDPKWQDCFFDGNSGGGDDGCRYPTSCLLGDTAADDPACKVAEACINFCAPLVPNGCDCFGCCSVQTPGGDSVDIFTTSTCSLAKLDDSAACPRCQKSALCNNPCGTCELCPGKTAADLPASCGPTPIPDGGEGGYGGGPEGTGGGSTTDGGVPPPNYTCDGGEQVCGPGLPGCDNGLYCQLGCCIVVVR